MANKHWRSILINGGIILLFITLSLFYFNPVLKGEELNAGDISNWVAMSKEARDYNQQNDDIAYWTNSMFGGMPTYFISFPRRENWIGNMASFVSSPIPQPANTIAIGFVCFFIMCLLLGINRWNAFIGSLMWALGGYFFILLSAGHYTKVHTLMYAPLLIGGVLYTYNRKAIMGALVAAMGLSLMIWANHPQMTYYAGLCVIIIGLAYLVDAIREKQLMPFVKSSAILIIALLLAVGSNYGIISSSLEYSKYSTRGKSDLNKLKKEQSGGLDKSYILDYSYDLGEAMTSFIPGFKGRGMQEDLGDKSETFKVLSRFQNKTQARKTVEQMPAYWGSQPISTAPFYFGAVVFFFFVLGLFILKGRDKWWVLAMVLLAFVLSLGKNIEWLSHFLIDYFPGYNKFRDVKNIVFLQHLAMVIMAMFAMKEVISSKDDKSKFTKHIIYSWGILGALCLLFVLIPSLAGNFSSPTDARLAQAGWPEELINALRLDRKDILRTDAMRSLFFVSVAAVIVWLYAKSKLKITYTILGLALAVLVDLWSFDKKYLNNDNFISAKKVENTFSPSAADKAILNDKDPNFRVLNITVNPFADASTSYFHKSIGGYHGAKLERYQELWDFQITKEMQGLFSVEGDNLDHYLSNAGILNMLNTKYIIHSPNSRPILNRNAMGNAWLINQVRLVEDADAEMSALSNFNPKQEAIVDEQFAHLLANIKEAAPQNQSIKQTKYSPNHSSYEANISAPTLAVFSEIYYPAGWVAYVDNQKTEHLRANYVLRALPLEQGVHTIDFKFESETDRQGKLISTICSILLLLSIAMVGYISLRKKEEDNEATKES